MERKGLSYGELTVLEDEFNVACAAEGIVWTDADVRSECLQDFISQYEEGEDFPSVRLLGYGYEKS